MWYSDSMVDHASNLIKSYFYVTGGKELVPMRILENDPTEAAKLLFFLPDRVVVSHGNQKRFGRSCAKLWQFCRFEEMGRIMGGAHEYAI